MSSMMGILPTVYNARKCRVYHELIVWSRGIIMDREAHNASSCIAAAVRAPGRYADNASDYADDPDRTNCLVRRYAPFGDRPIAGLVNETRNGLPGHIASIPAQASHNRGDRGMDVPAELREGGDPAKHLHLREDTYSMPLNHGVGA